MSFVYYLRDRAGDPLYIGTTASMQTRMTAHRAKPWWGQVCSITCDKFPSADEASREEIRQIQAHQPPHNLRYTDRDPQLKRNRTILEAAAAVVDAAVGTPTGVLVPQAVLDDLAQAVDRADAAAVAAGEVVAS